MNTVKLFFNGTDVMPNVLLQHFLHYLGFYVHRNEDGGFSREMDSVADIYVISDEFVKTQSQLLESMDEKKSIIVLTEGWSYEEDSVHTVVYEEDDNRMEFLTGIIWALYEICNRDGRISLFDGCFSERWRTAFAIADAYVKYELLESSLITRCFYKQNDFYSLAIEKYERFIEEISDYASDFEKYVSLFAKYEADLISRTNKYVYRYDTGDLLWECNELLRRYPGNEELHLLRADILFELEENWMDGCDRYSDREVRHCSYAYLKRGKILRTYYKDYMNAEVLLKAAISMNLHYFQAWYQLGECYDAMGRYDKAIKAFQQVHNILESKYKKSVLAPIEWEYFYKSVMRIAIIYKVRLGDYSSAYAFNDMGREMRESHAIDEYIKIMRLEEMGIPNIKAIIYETLKEHVDIKLEEVY